MLRKIIGLFILLFSIQAFATTEKQAQEIDSFMHSFIQTFEARDLEVLGSYYHPDATIVGTGQDEVLQGRDNIMKAFERDMDQHTTMHIEYKRIGVDVKKHTAFAAYALKVFAGLPNQKQVAEYDLRFTLGLVKYHHAWHIMQSHLSAPLAGQAAGQSYPTSNNG